MRSLLLSPFKAILLFILYAARRKWSLILHLTIVWPLIWGRNKLHFRRLSIGKQCLHKIIWWLAVIITKLFDLIGTWEVIDMLYTWYKPHLRTLTDHEIEQLKMVYGDTFYYHAVRIDENSSIARMGARFSKKPQLGVVVFRHIHFTRKLDCKNNARDMEWLIHEFMHIVQFNKIGSQYIIEALYAQNTSGYNPGGEKQLKAHPKLWHFNLEQQAEIARYAYRAMINQDASSNYLHYVDQIRWEDV